MKIYIADGLQTPDEASKAQTKHKHQKLIVQCYDSLKSSSFVIQLYRMLGASLSELHT